MQGSIFLTGGAGFLGRAMIRQSIAAGWDCSFTVFSRDETKQDQLLQAYGKQAKIRCLLGDVCDPEHLAHAMAGHETVIHMAAVKYIPEAEKNRWECVRVNVDGSKNVIAAAHRAGVRTCIGISTDKAVAPVNTYGATKYLMEGLFAEANRWQRTNFVTCRYGNVVGSTGSVIPHFEKQIRDHRQITITDARMTRFWLSPFAAVQLIDHAWQAAETFRGAVFVEACPSMSIEDLADAVILASDVPGVLTREDVDVVEIGRRPGEKLNEDLLSDSEAGRALNWMNGYAIMEYGDPSLAVSHDVQAYNSADPRSWVTPAQMAEWIADARAI